ncbi:MAG: DUF6383 domain-containing protein [Tannerella sp.]|nr:DUF6383 domain-containing protein [Tannerella sp.]
MNKKIFTLLTGAILMFSLAFSASAQNTPPGSHTGGAVWSSPANKLYLGDTVKTLADGANAYYHLKIDSIALVNGAGVEVKASGGILNDSLVLYLGRAINRNGLLDYNHLFIDTLNYARTHKGTLIGGDQFAPFTTESKAEESAASLWCVITRPYEENGAQVASFDFLNKQQKALLEVSVDSAKTGSNDRKEYATADSAYARSGLSSWGFSAVYKNKGLPQRKPLYTEVPGKPDIVAVLCIDTMAYAGGAGEFKVVVREVPANFVNGTGEDYGNVPGLLFFTIWSPAPFLLDAEDINTHFGTYPDGDNSERNFSMPGISDENNPFLDGNLRAVYIDSASYGLRITLPTGFPEWDGTALSPSSSITGYGVDTVRGSYLDSLGYLWIHEDAATNAKYLRALNEYWTVSTGNTKHLKLGLDGNLRSVERGNYYNAVGDSTGYGQYAWRFIYDPATDDIAVNTFQATYSPYEFLPELAAYYGTTAKNWTDSVVLARFTFFADTLALDSAELRKTYSSFTNWQDLFASTSTEWWRAATVPLTPGDSTDGDGFYEFNLYHKLYVTSQNLLTSEEPVVTLGQDDGTTTIINFGLYDQCKAGGGIGNRASIPPGVYLIRSEGGQYLHVPLYSVHDSAEWTNLNTDVHPELLPSFQWIVEKRYTDPAYTNSSQITLVNREFPWLRFENIQLTIDQKKLDLYPDFDWNIREVTNSSTTSFADRGTNTHSFIDLTTVTDKDGKLVISDPYLGYTYIDSKVADTAIYAFNYKFGQYDRYLSKNDDNVADSVVYAQSDNFYTRLYFKLDTVTDKFGKLAEYGYPVQGSKGKTQIPGLVQLVRQPYRLVYQDPYKFVCYNNLSVVNGTDHNYRLGSAGEFKDILGIPSFYLRNVYYNETLGDTYFALVQLFDYTSTLSGTYDTEDDMMDALEAYLKRMYGEVYAEKVVENLQLGKNKNGQWNPGILVAAVNVDDGTARLQAQVRADNETRVSTFRRTGLADPIYRRFNTEKEGTPDDSPDTVKFFTINEQPHYQLFENQGNLTDQKRYWTNPKAGLLQQFDGGKQYLGLVNTLANEVEMKKYNVSTAIFVDTAYINRGTGPIKPQYMLAVRPHIVEAALGCNDVGEPTVPLPGYVYAHYLINAYDSAHLDGGVEDVDYLWDYGWSRLVFTPAIHANDALYILGDAADLFNAEGKAIKSDKYEKLFNKTSDNTGFALKVDKLDAYCKELGIKKIELGDNTHKDCVFSFRLIERHNNEEFLIESETTVRGEDNPILRPCDGGWVKVQNGVPCISRGLDHVKDIGEGDVFNVVKASDVLPVSNEEVAAVTPVTVTGNTGSVSILNAAGKKVVINNILGQAVATTVLASDNATVQVPITGIVIVSVEGEPAVKAQVK